LKDLKSVSLLRDFFSKGHERTVTAKKNIAVSFLLKGGSVLTLFFMVPMTINYVSPAQYGIWVTLGSVISWFSFFDIGFGNGLKNKLTESIAKGEDGLAKIYVSTTYLILTVIGAALLLIFFFVNHYLDWSKILNVTTVPTSELNRVAFILFAIFCIQFVLQLITTICTAAQNTILATAIMFFGNVLSLMIVYVFSRTTEGSLLNLCFSVGIGPLISLTLFSIVLYTSAYRKYAPSFRIADMAYARNLMRLGIKFFLIQMGFILFYNINYLIISRLMGADSVTPYNIAFQYFSAITMISGIVMTPFWAAFTDANAKEDYDWIKRTVNKLEKVCAGIFLLSLIMLAASPWVYSIWIGKQVTIPVSLSMVFAFYVAMNTLRTVYCYYLNGTGKIMLQIYILIVSAVINIPLAVVLGKFLGITGVILSTTILSAFCGIIEYTQYKKLINRQAMGVWNE
jgi:O-antigen/teichoic acid export membrane protein